jgi:uncharacterized integral membrane protein
MFTLLVTVILGVAFAYFASQNNVPVNLNLGGYFLPSVPLYLVALFPLLLGLLVSFFIHMVKDLSQRLTINEGENNIKKLVQENAELTKEVHKLELENVKLKAKKENIDEESF